MRKSFDDLTIADDFMFCKIMVSSNVRPVHCLTTSFSDEKLAAAWNHRPPWRFCIANALTNRREHKLTAGLLKSVLPCTLFNDKFF